MRAQIELSARRHHPAESCGLLLGRSIGARVEVELERPARNLLAGVACDRYELDPTDQLAAEDEARARGLEVVGVWHSHPDLPAMPSELDRARAWEGWSYVIVSITAAGARELRSWRLVSGNFVEEELEA